MTIIIFILVLSVLVFVHELGHFLFAKRAGIKVTEFAIGFPPRLYAWTPEGSETTYAINAIPFGGYVKIFGEDGADEEVVPEDQERLFTSKPRYIQALVLVGGVLFNAIFAWLLFSFALASGMPAAVTPELEQYIDNPELTITMVLPDSPAAEAGFEPGDVVREVNSTLVETPDQFREYMQTADGEVSVGVVRAGEEEILFVTPSAEVGSSEAPAIGVGIDRLGIVELPIHIALIEGVSYTWALGKAMLVGFGDFISRSFAGEASVSEVAGPVGIAGLVGSAAESGFVSLMTFSAFLSLNLAILNLLPFPALDGGRLIVLLIEAIRGKELPQKAVQYTNMIGFALLMLLMLAVTVNDVVRLF